MTTLAIECSALATSVAVVKDSCVLGESFLHSGKAHSQTLMPMLTELLKNLQLGIEDIDLIAVTKGPGSFTGVRIGVAAVKGLAMPFNTPTIGISTLENLAYGLVHTKGLICPVLDARCAQVYCGAFLSDGVKMNRVLKDSAIPIDELVDRLKNFDEDIIFTGDGAHLVQPLVAGSRLAPAQLLYPRAGTLGILAQSMADTATDCARLTPAYIRLPQAVRERLKRENG